ACGAPRPQQTDRSALLRPVTPSGAKNLDGYTRRPRGSSSTRPTFFVALLLGNGILATLHADADTTSSTMRHSASGLNGLARKPSAPARRARARVPGSSWPLSLTTRTSRVASLLFSDWQSRTPSSSPGRPTSTIASSGFSLRAIFSASSAFCASKMRTGAGRSVVLISRRMIASSSTSRTAGRRSCCSATACPARFHHRRERAGDVAVEPRPDLGAQQPPDLARVQLRNRAELAHAERLVQLDGGHEPPLPRDRLAGEPLWVAVAVVAFVVAQHERHDRLQEVDVLDDPCPDRRVRPDLALLRFVERALLAQHRRLHDDVAD